MATSTTRSLTKKDLAFLTRAFARKGTHEPRVFEAGEALAFGGAWGALEGRIDRAQGRFEIHERQDDGATLLLSGSLDDAASLETLVWDDFAYDFHLTALAAANTPGEAPPVGLSTIAGTVCFTYAFRRERGRMLFFALRRSDGSLVGLLLGDEASLGTLAPPPLGCPVLRALLARHAEILGPPTGMSDPEVIAALRASHRDDKKGAKSVAETHVERALSFNRARLASLLERIPSFAADAEAVRAIEPRPTSKSWGEVLYEIQARLIETELAMRPSPEPIESSNRARALGRWSLGVTVWPAELKGVRWWGPATDLASICVQAAETAAVVGLWSASPDPVAMEAWLVSLAPPSLEAFVDALGSS